MNYGPLPAQQRHWDARAAANFICGGAGSGLVMFAVLFGTPDTARSVSILTGLALVALGLVCAWFEIGRPARALNVFLHPRRSWMSREAVSALLLFAAGLGSLVIASTLAWVAAALAAVFMYCQARMLHAARGIPAWRAPRIVPLLLTTALAEGGGLYLAAGAAYSELRLEPLVALATAVLARAWAWRAYRRTLSVAPAAKAALDRTGRLLQIAGTLLPLLLLAIVAAARTTGDTVVAMAILTALLVVASGAHLKLTLITRAGYNQGYALAHLPVRGQR